MPDSFEKLPALETLRHCLNCPPRPARAKLNMYLDPGFGYVDVTRDGTNLMVEIGERTTLQKIENIAFKNPDHDWRVTIHAPLYDATYQRQGLREWVLVEKGRGFA